VQNYLFKIYGKNRVPDLQLDLLPVHFDDPGAELDADSEVGRKLAEKKSKPPKKVNFLRFQNLKKNGRK
jgi:hypothetical protein